MPAAAGCHRPDVLVPRQGASARCVRQWTPWSLGVGAAPGCCCEVFVAVCAFLPGCWCCSRFLVLLFGVHAGVIWGLLFSYAQLDLDSQECPYCSTLGQPLRHVSLAKTFGVHLTDQPPLHACARRRMFMHVLNSTLFETTLLHSNMFQSAVPGFLEPDGHFCWDASAWLRREK